MLDLHDYTYTPSLEELCDYIQNPLATTFCTMMQQTYQAKVSIDFSKCSWEYGWNIKFKKSGKTLCTLYPRFNYFTLMVVVSAKEKEAAESFFKECHSQLPQIYQQTQEGNNQRWLMIDLEDEDCLYQDTCKLIEIRRKSK